MIATTSMELDTKYVTWDLWMSERTLRNSSTKYFFHNMPMIDTGDIVILFGEVSAWVYGIALDKLRDQLMSVVAVFDKDVGGAVVVRSYIRDRAVGDIIPCNVNGFELSVGVLASELSVSEL
jgi:hypothetical protein